MLCLSHRARDPGIQQCLPLHCDDLFSKERPPGRKLSRLPRPNASGGKHPARQYPGWQGAGDAGSDHSPVSAPSTAWRGRGTVRLAAVRPPTRGRADEVLATLVRALAGDCVNEPARASVGAGIFVGFVYDRCSPTCQSEKGREAVAQRGNGRDSRY